MAEAGTIIVTGTITWQKKTLYGSNRQQISYRSKSQTLTGSGFEKQLFCSVTFLLGLESTKFKDSRTA
ncbi:MAG: hypothetical protein PUP92_12955 [Rhizonema sp. PD38]|nr:hypothetical protein [Rhizonema sp. PD38]